MQISTRIRQDAQIVAIHKVPTLRGGRCGPAYAHWLVQEGKLSFKRKYTIIFSPQVPYKVEIKQTES